MFLAIVAIKRGVHVLAENPQKSQIFFFPLWHSLMIEYSFYAADVAMCEYCGESQKPEEMRDQTESI